MQEGYFEEQTLGEVGASMVDGVVGEGEVNEEELGVVGCNLG